MLTTSKNTPRVRSEVFTAVRIQVRVLWIVMPYSVNVGILPQHYTALRPIIPLLEHIRKLKEMQFKR